MSFESRLAHVEAELARVRRRAARHKTLALLALSALTLGATVQRGTPLVVRAKSLEVLDDAGRVVFRAAAGEDGGSLALFDRAGQALAALSSENGASLVLQNPAGREVFRVASTALGGEAVWSDAAGRETAALFPSAQGGALSLSHRSGTKSAELVSGAAGGMLALRRPDGTRVLEASDSDGQASVLIGGLQDSAGIALTSNVGTANLAMSSVGLEAPGDKAPVALSLDVQPGQSTAVVGEVESAFIARSQRGLSEIGLFDRGGQALRAASQLGAIGLWLQDGEGNSVFGVSTGDLTPPPKPPAERETAKAVEAGDSLAASGAAKEALDRRKQLLEMIETAPGQPLKPMDILRLKAANKAFQSEKEAAAGQEPEQGGVQPGGTPAPEEAGGGRGANPRGKSKNRGSR